MALFKLMRGSASRLPSDKTDGYIWVTYDENNVLHMYIDYEDDNKVLQRGILSAEFANKLRYTADGTIVEIKPEDLVGKVIKDTEGNKLGEIFNNYEKNQASGLHSHAEGSTTVASATGAHAEGILTTASGERSHAEGSTTTASGQGSHAEGVNTTASGDRSHAEGSGSGASGAGAHAEGVNTRASGMRSHAEGSNSEASGAGAHAEGVDTVADGEASHSEGKGTIAKGEAQHAGGTFNIIDDNNEYLEIVGNGTNNENRSNARTLDRNGNAWYAGEVYVGVDKKRLVAEDELVQSDWNQNDENASNYVKNRTHYEKYSTTAQTVNYNPSWYWNSNGYCIELYGSNMPNFKQNDGTDWILMGEAANIETKEVYNENTSETETYYVPVSANYSIQPVFGYTMESIYDIYFQLRTPNDDEWQYDYNNEHQVTMSCVKNITTITVHKLDEKYLPENIANKDYVEGKIEDSKADYNQNDSTRASYIKNRPFYDTYINKVKTYSPGYRDGGDSSRFYISTIDAISGQPPYFDIVKTGRRNYKLNGEVAQVITVPETTVSVHDDSVGGYKDVVLPSFQGLKSENFQTFYWIYNEYEFYIGIESNLSEFLSTFTIEYQERELKQLDEKYIPDTIARTSIIKDLSNALKGNKSGETIIMSDVSPLEHEMDVKVRSKNLLSPNSYAIHSQVKNGVEFTVYDDGSILLNGTVTKAESFYLYNNRTSLIPNIKVGDILVISKNVNDDAQQANLYMALNYYDENGNMQPGISASLTAQYSGVVKDTWKGIGIYIHTPLDKTYNNLLIKPMVEIGSEATAYTPYVDVTTAKVMRYGKNLFDEQLEIGGINTSTGANDDTVKNTLRTTNYIKVLPSTVYFVACPTGVSTLGGLLQIYRYDKDKNFLGYGSTGIENTTMRTGEDWQYIRFVIRAEYGTVYKNDICLTMSSTATDYEPSQKTTYPISADGTVEGVSSLYPTTTLMADTDGIVLDVEYNRDINSAFAELTQAIISLGGNI